MKNFLMVVAVLFAAGLARADWISDAKSKTEKELKPLVGDVGAVLGSGFWSPAKKGGLWGFDIALQVAASDVSDDNHVLSSDDTIGASWIYVSKGIPFVSLDVSLRAMQAKMESSEDKINFFGLGLEYNLIKDRVVSPFPGISLLFAANALNASGLDATTATFGAKASKKLPFITPFAALAAEKTKMDVDSVVLGTLKPEESRFRLIAGMEFRLIPFTYLNVAVTKSGKVSGVQIAAGIKK